MFTFSAFLPFVSHEVNLEKDMQRLAVVIRKHNVRGGVILQFRLMTPDYSIKKGKLISRRAANIHAILIRRAGEKANEVKVSYNCLDGRKLIEQYIQIGS